MIGVAALWGTPFPPWHVLQTSNLAPRKASASGAFPGVGNAATSSTAFAGMARTARATRTPKRVGRRLLIMSALPLFECRVRVLRYGAIKPLKHAAVAL